jgi:hypothetical protein
MRAGCGATALPDGRSLVQNPGPFSQIPRSVLPFVKVRHTLALPDRSSTKREWDSAARIP